MTREQAINYLYSSGMSNEQVQAVVEALQAQAETIDFDSLSDSQTIHHLTDEAYSELCLLAAKGREALQAQADGDCISRSQARSEYADWYGYGYQDDWFYKHLANMPSVAIPNKTGEWFGTVCSNCGESVSFYYDCDYCPNCGSYNGD